MASNPQPMPVLIKPSSTSQGTGDLRSTEGDPYSIKRETVDSRGSSNLNHVLDATALYPNVESGPVLQAQRLIGECLEFLKKADKTPPGTMHLIEYDSLMIRARHLLRRLFELRHIGDGFGATINGLLCSLHNKQAERLTAKQFSAVCEALGQLQRRPRLHFDSANGLLDQLEDVGLDIEPPFVEQITGYLDE